MVKPNPKIFCEDTLKVEELVTAITRSVAPFAYVSISTPEFASGNDPSLSKETTLPLCEIVPESYECKFKFSKELFAPTTSNAFPKAGI